MKKIEKNVKKWISETRLRIEKQSKLSEIADPTQKNIKNLPRLFSIKMQKKYRKNVGKKVQKWFPKL